MATSNEPGDVVDTYKVKAKRSTVWKCLIVKPTQGKLIIQIKFVYSVELTYQVI